MSVDRQKIRADGGEAIALPLDVTNADSVKEFVLQASEQLGDIEVLVAGAGDTNFGRLHEIDTETFESQIQIHLIGASRLTTAVLPGMVAPVRRRHLRGFRCRAEPATVLGRVRRSKSRTGGDGHQRSVELEGTGVCESIVHPGPTKTGMGWNLLSSRSARPSRTAPSGVKHVTTISCVPSTWLGRSPSWQKRPEAASGPTWSFNPRPRWSHTVGASTTQSRRESPRPTITATIPRVSGGDDKNGHPEEFRIDPIGLRHGRGRLCISDSHRVRDECGDVGRFQLADKQVILPAGELSEGIPKQIKLNFAGEKLPGSYPLSLAKHPFRPGPAVALANQAFASVCVTSLC